MNKVISRLIVLLLLGVAYPTFAQKVFVYPSKGQSSQQQERDQSECYTWAKSNTGYDPANPESGASQPSQAPQQTGGVVRGAVGGAVLGAIVGDSSKAAGRGAVVGGLFGGVRQSRGNQQAQQQQQQRQQAGQSARRNDYNRAYAACLKGRGYTVE